jgi:hypothetical protein
MIAWKKELDHIIEVVPDGSDRIQAIKLLQQDLPILLINCYMPTQGCKDPAYEDVLDEVNELMNKFWQLAVLWTGDLNADVLRAGKYYNDRLLQEFLTERHLKISELQQPTATYHHFNGTSKSRLDIFITGVTFDSLKSITNDHRHIINLSSHDAVTATLNILLPNDRKPDNTDSLAAPHPRIKWAKLDYHRYELLTGQRLKVLQNAAEGTPVDIIITQVNDILLRSANEACPPDRKRAGTKRKRPWNPTMKPLVANIKSIHYRVKHSARTSSKDVLALKAAKKLLRQAQRQAAAKKRNDAKSAIMRACRSKDQREFFKLVKKQRHNGQQSGALEFNSLTAENQPNSWANYFEHLATPTNDSSYDQEYEGHLHVMHLLRQLRTVQSDAQLLPPVTTKDVSTYVNNLKSGKSPDLFGIAAEHLKMASPILIDILSHICNDAISTGRLPSAFKHGIVSPVLKKGKSHKDPNGYRRITITSVVGKVLERHMLKYTNDILDKTQSHLQFGFTTGCYPMYAALALTEIMAEAKDSGKELYLTFMDSSKAFDVVDHHSMLNALYEQDIQGNLYSMYSSMYSGIQSTVKWEGHLSRTFHERQGIRQGGISSPALYKAERNKGLIQLDKNPTMMIGNLNVGAIMVADDLALTASTATEMQEALCIAATDACRERYNFNLTKTKMIAINCKDPSKLLLNGEPIGNSDKEKHLGIVRNNKNTNTDTILMRIKDARRTAYSLLGAGLCGLNGSGPEVALTLYSTYVLPQLLYGLETLVLKTSEIEELNKYHRRNLRHLMCVMDSLPLLVQIYDICFQSVSIIILPNIYRYG